MDTTTILSKLHASKFPYTDANKFRNELKTVTEEERRFILAQIHAAKGRAENKPIRKALDQMVWNVN